MLITTLALMEFCATTAYANCPNITVPSLSQQATNLARIVVQEAFPTSYVRVTVANVPPGFSLTNGVYLGWCVEYLAQLYTGNSYPVTIYDSYGPLPSRLQSPNWDLVNYIINHKQGDADDVQVAIWHFIGGPVPASDARYGTPSSAALAIINDALANGEGFVPTQPGQVAAVILDPGAGVQILIGEVPVGFNRPPVAGPDNVTTPRNVALSVPLSTLLANDSDPDGDVLTVVSVGGSSTQGGTAVLSGGNIFYTPPLNFTGSDTFTYVITDNKCGSATGLVTVAVTSGPGPTNNPPTVNNDVVTTERNTTLTINSTNLLANDTDVDGDTLTIISVSTNSMQGGTVQLIGDNVIYTPPPGFVGADTFTYTVSDGQGGTATGTVTVNVTQPNTNPVVNNDTVTTERNTTLTINSTNLLANDTDVDGDTLTIISVSTNSMQGGTVQLIGGNVIYTPPPGFVGTDTFTYTVSDGQGGTATGTVTVNVVLPNTSPVAGNTNVTTQFDAPVFLSLTSVLALASDADGDGLTIIGVTAASVPGATVILTSSNIIIVPPAGFVGDFQFSYIVSDGRGGTATGIITVTVLPPVINRDPVAANDTATTDRNVALTVPASTLLANDTDPDGDSLTITGVSSSSTQGGTVQMMGTNIIYTPPLNFTGTDTFTYSINDGRGGTSTATVTVTVKLPNTNTNPVANNDTAVTDRNLTLTIATTNLLSNDTDADGDILTITGVSGTSTQGGTVQLAGGDVIYAPPLNFTGTDTFTYTVDDGHSGTSTATVTVTVRLPNTPPLAANYTVQTPFETPALIQFSNLLALATDADGDPLTVVAVGTSSVANAAIALTSSNIVAVPPPGFIGSFDFDYVISDGRGGLGNATITVVVLPSPPTNRAPVAVNDTATTERNTTLTIGSTNLLANDTDADGDTLTITGVSGTSTQGGTVLVLGPDIIYTPPAGFVGNDAFTYTISDGFGGTATGTVSVNVTHTNASPVANNDTATTVRNTPLTINSATLLANDTDADGDTLTITGVSATSTQGGTVQLVGGIVTYTPPLNFTGPDTFTYAVSDGQGGTATGTVTVNVTPPNINPIANNDTVIGDANTPLTISGTTLLANDTDADGGTLTITGVSSTSTQGGTVELVGGNVIYTPPPGFVGTDTFTYTVSDGQGGTSTATVTVEVRPPNRPPTALSTTLNTFVNVPASITLLNLLALASDPDGDPLTIISIGAVSNIGVGQLTATNLIAFPPTNFVGTFTLTYTVSDGRGGTATANVDVNVLNVPFSFSVTPAVFNPQTGLFEQNINIVNDSGLTVPAMQVNITGLRTNTIRVWNATGTNDGVPYLLFNRALNPGDSGSLKVEYYVPDRKPFIPTINVVPAMPATPTTLTNAPGVMIDRAFVDSRDGQRFVIEWASIPDRTYVVFYSDDMTLWKAATPSVRAVASRTQWYDDGPPKTDFKPPTSSSRLYRVVLMP